MRRAASLLRPSAVLCGGDRHGAARPFRASSAGPSGCSATARTRFSRTTTRPRRCAPRRSAQHAHVVMQRAYLPGAVPRSGGARTEWARVPRVLVPLRRTARRRCDGTPGHVDVPGVLRIVDRRDSHEQTAQARQRGRGAGQTRSHTQVRAHTHTCAFARTHSHTHRRARARNSSPGRIEVLEDDFPIEGFERSYRRQRLEVRNSVQQTTSRRCNMQPRACNRHNTAGS